MFHLGTNHLLTPEFIQEGDAGLQTTLWSYKWPWYKEKWPWLGITLTIKKEKRQWRVQRCEHWDCFDCRLYLIASFLLILPGFFYTDTWTRLAKILRNMSFKSLMWFPPLFAQLLFFFAICTQGEKWDQRFQPVRWDLNKWFSSKTIFPHLSSVRGFICLVICTSVNRLMVSMDKGRDWVEGGRVDEMRSCSGVCEACWEVMEQPRLRRTYWTDKLGLTFH